MKMIKALVSSSMIALILYVLSAAPSLPQSPKLNDAEVASFAVTANQIDINYAAVAKTKSKNPDILKFAETMTNDHKAVIAQAVAIGYQVKSNS